MSTSSLDVTAYADAMKDVWFNKGIQDQLNNNQKLVSIFKKDVAGFPGGGNSTIASIKTSRNYAVRSISDGGITPNAGTPTYKKLTIPKRLTYAKLSITDGSIEMSKRSEAAFKNALDEIAEDAVESIDKHRERSLCGYGRGILALVNGAGSGTTTLTVDAPLNIAGSTNGSRYLKPGMQIAIVDTTTLLPLCIRTISSVATTGLTVTLNAAVSAVEAPNDAYIVLASTDGSDIESSIDLEPMGLLGIVDDGTYVGTYFGQSRTSIPILKSSVLASTGTLTAGKLQRVLDAVHRQCGFMPDCHVMDHSIRREYMLAPAADFQYTNDKMNPDLGFDGGGLNGELSFTKSKIYVVNEMPYGFWVMLNSKFLVRTIDSEGSWVDDDGGVLRRTQGRNAFEAEYKIFENFWGKRPNTCGRLDGISATIDVDNIL